MSLVSCIIERQHENISSDFRIRMKAIKQE